MSEIKTKSSVFMESRPKTPVVSANMAKSVSDYRKQVLAQQVEGGQFRDGSNNTPNVGATYNSNVVASVGIRKTAQVSGGATSGSSNYKGGFGDSVKQSPEVYSPLWLDSNMSLPRDRATINAWCRSFYALNPFVHNAISLHSTYPISKLNIKCPNKEVENFFNEMIEETDLMNVAVQIAQEYWLLGESFPYAELDSNKGKWNRILIQNPDYMVVKRTVVASEPLIMLRPDENLKKIITSNKPSDIEQRKQLNGYIIDSVKKGGFIPLDNLHVSHLARRISPYEIRGTGLPVCIFRNLMLFDKLRESKFAQASNMINPLTLVKVGGEGPDALHPTHEDLEAWRATFECHDEETEVLTDKGFKKFDEVIHYDMNNVNIGKCEANTKEGFKIACFNPNNEQLEYHNPLAAHVYNYDGEMFHFNNKKIDIKVTPNHKMYASKRKYEFNGRRSLRKTYWEDFKKIEAKDLDLKDCSRFRSKLKWTGKEIESVNVLGTSVPIELYLEFLGYVLSKTHSNIGSNIIANKDLYEYIKNEDEKVKAPNKRVPRWILELSPRLLNIFLEALVKRDGSKYVNSNKTNRFMYYSTSKQLADDVYEIAYKCGYVPTEFVSDVDACIKFPIYNIEWSNANNSNYPLVYKTSRNSVTKEKHNNLNIEQYNGKVWCFTVPTGLFITRRDGKITIQGNSAQYDKDFKIFTHAGVTVEKVGSGAGIYDISGDITQLIKEIYVGLQVPSSLMDGGADTTYANAGVALDVLRQRYMQFRNMMSSWLKRKIFAPISKIQGFYEYKGKEKKLIVPDIDWNHMSLFDAGDYISTLKELTTGDDKQKRASLHTLYRSLGLEWEDEMRKIRKEAIQTTIFEKEKAALEAMDLNSLRTLDDDDEITEPDDGEESTVPGETPSGDSGAMPDLGMPGGPPPPMPEPLAAPSTKAPV